MRIISDFQDYYDSALALGSDSTRIYHRRASAEGLDNGKAPEPWSRLIAHEKDTLDRFPLTFTDVFRPFLVCFCGNVYPGLQMPAGTQLAGAREDLEYSTFYDSQSAYDAIRLHPVKELRAGPYSFSRGTTLKQRLTKYFSLKGSDIIKQRLVDDKVAVAILMLSFSRSTVVTDARLADFQFYKVIDAWTAFQELDMFWGGVLAPESKPAPSVVEKDRLVKHGFDQRSFRKPPSKTRR
jgi:hypothetical protein